MNELARYECNGQEIVITEEDIKNVLCTGGDVTDKEIKMFLELCKAQQLNPFIKEAYLVKYGNNPAQIIVGKDVFIKRASRNPRFKGYQAGIAVISNNTLQHREGANLLQGEQLVGGWCAVYVDGYEKPMKAEVSLTEYSTGKSTWQKMPSTMIRKVAICHALREAFPEDLSGCYGAEEMSQAEPNNEPYEENKTAQSVEAVEVVQQETVEPEVQQELDTKNHVLEQMTQKSRDRLNETCFDYANEFGQSIEMVYEFVANRKPENPTKEFYDEMNTVLWQKINAHREVAESGTYEEDVPF